MQGQQHKRLTAFLSNVMLTNYVEARCGWLGAKSNRLSVRQQSRQVSKARHVHTQDKITNYSILTQWSVMFTLCRALQYNSISTTVGGVPCWNNVKLINKINIYFMSCWIKSMGESKAIRCWDSWYVSRSTCIPPPLQKKRRRRMFYKCWPCNLWTKHECE